MAQHLLKLRVRPSRATVLISKHAQVTDLFLAFEFFSKIWGGRYSQILAVNPEVPDGLTEFRLGNSRPDFVYSIGLNNEVWANTVQQACQPRGYGDLQPDFVKGIKQSHHENYWLVDHALIHLSRIREQSRGRKRHLRLVRAQPSSPLESHCAAVFGIHHADLREEFFDEEIQFQGEDPCAFVELATDFVKKRHKSWLDVTGHELNLWSSWWQIAPTVVLVDDIVSDLSLFWNLRTSSSHQIPAWIIPLPVSCVASPKLLDRLKHWLLEFLAFGSRPNYCNVTSQTASEEACRMFAAAFKEVMVGTPIEIVTYDPPRNRLPDIIPYEYDTVWPVDITGRRLTIQPPRPKAFEDLGSPCDWHVDLLKDANTGRAVKELQLPPGKVAFELLNGPCPPHYYHSIIPRTGDGQDSINFRCSKTDEVIHVHLPIGSGSPGGDSVGIRT